MSDDKYVNISDEDILKQQALIGEFIIRFETICMLIRVIITNLCNPDDDITCRRNIETLLEGLTAEPLNKKLFAIINDHVEEENIINALNPIKGKFNELIKVRNDIAHGTIIQSWGDFNGSMDPNRMLFRKSKSTATGYNKNSMIISNSAIEHVIQQANLISNLYGFMSTLVIEYKGRIEDQERQIRHINKFLDLVGKIQLKYIEIIN